MPARRPLMDRFEEKYIPEPNSGCWLWIGGLNGSGYGCIGLGIGRRSDRAHRVAWRLHNGEIPDGLVIDHKCRVRSCVNPDHLELVTLAENIRRGEAGRRTGAKQRAKTHCPKGHPYEGWNLMVYDGKRHCRRCGNERRRRGWNASLTIQG